MAIYAQREELITEDQNWVAPEALNQKFSVRIWGAGGSGSFSGDLDNVGGAGGGSGYMAEGEFELPVNTMVEIEIGSGGKGIETALTNEIDEYLTGKSGGTSYFGTYLSAAGGCGGQYDEGGIGGVNGAAPGMTAQGGHGGGGVTASVDGHVYSSGGGGMAVNGVGRGGAANFAQGDAGIAAGGAGCMITKVNSVTDTPTLRIGSGGNGMCYITYYQEINVPPNTEVVGAVTTDEEGNIVPVNTVTGEIITDSNS